MKQQRAALIPSPGVVAARFKVVFTNRQRMDVHNAVETVLDLLQGICYDNDKQVPGFFHPPVRHIDNANPRVEVELQTEDEAFADPRWAP